MSEFLNPHAPDPAAQERFYSGAAARIGRFILVLAAPAAIAVGLWLGWQAALGCVAGVAAGYYSFTSLERAVNALADRITGGGSQEHGGRIIGRLLLRYLLVAAIAFAIMSVSRGGLRGFLAGLCVPVLAMMCEAGYELTMALRRGL